MIRWCTDTVLKQNLKSSQCMSEKKKRNKCTSVVNVNVILTVFFDSNEVVHHDSHPQDITVNKEYYLEVMKHLHEAIRKKAQYLEVKQKLYGNNVPAHISL